MPNRKGKTGNKGGRQVWKESSKSRDSSSVADSVGSANSAADQGKNNKLTGLSIGELKKRVQNVASTVQFGSVPSKEPSPVQGEKTVWKPKHYGTVSGSTNAMDGAASAEKNSAGSSKVRTRMIEMVSKGLASLETFREAWGTEAFKKQAEFNDFLERNHMCISMELDTAVLGDHGQRPLEDYGSQSLHFLLPVMPCAKKEPLRLVKRPCIQVQGEILEGLVARMVSHESSKHMEKVLKGFPQPSEGATHDLGPSLREICAANRSDEKQQIKALLQSVGSYFCPNLVDWFGDGSGDAHLRNADRSVVSEFLHAVPTDYATTKLQEVVCLISGKRFPAALKCYYNFHKITSLAANNVQFKMVIHVYRDSAFRKYQKEMRHNPGLWPLYRGHVSQYISSSTSYDLSFTDFLYLGFFVDINLFKVSKDKAAEDNNVQSKNANGSSETSTSGADGLADEDANLMIKLKFLTYKIQTFLIRNGLLILFKDGPAAYRTYYLRQMKIWGTSSQKQKELSKMLDEWASYIRRKCGNKKLSSSIYLTEAEPSLEQYARRSPHNQMLIESAGNLVRSDDFLAIVESGRDEEGDLETGRNATTSSPTRTVMDSVRKDEGLIVFFPGIPGCAKSALCKEIGGLGDDRPVHSLMGDLIKGKYWQMVANERRKKPYTITLADKNAPNE
ncbi:hypothetical protein C5167_033011 [Papaver somniferum]|uniref:Uncharacterized protein n=1 Tax=Papaver somniferum TaxID=3469 RepID=A0A4Y7KD73_PAPSO|nr:hypothetical protein C5167_033011 [Papaver somniferum]